MWTPGVAFVGEGGRADRPGPRPLHACSRGGHIPLLYLFRVDQSHVVADPAYDSSVSLVSVCEGRVWLGRARTRENGP
eukprot:scaffold15702_cov66-Phaeocystis_antarctica.AAC.9